MKKIVTAFLCALLLSALPVLAAQPDVPAAAIAAPTARAVPATADVTTDLKLQQQKLEFFKERLEMQDKHIGFFGWMIELSVAFFGILITAVVLILGLRSVNEAKSAASDEINKRANEYIEADLRPAVDKALKDIQIAADKRLEDLRKAQEVTQELNAQQEALIKELASAPLDKDKPLTPEQKQELKKAVKNIESVPPKEYRSSDWHLLGRQAYEQGKYEIAAEYFSRAVDIAVSPMDRVVALANRGGALGQLQRYAEAITIFDEVVKDYGEASEVTLRVQVASALANKGVVLSQLQQTEEAIIVYDEVVKRYSEASEVALRETVARALVNKGVGLGQLQQNEKAITVYNKVVECYGEAPEAGLREAVAKALVNKGVALDQLQRIKEAITVYNKVVECYGEAPEVALRVLVATARTLKNRVQSDRPD